MKSKILITGVTSGIGRSLTIESLKRGYHVWGIARRGSILREIKKNTKKNKFDFTSTDLSQSDAWEKIIRQIKRKKFVPNIVVFNAAISEDDLKDGIDLNSTRDIFETNYFSVLDGIERLLPYVKKDTQFIGISSISALKGNAREGIGYSGSKSSLNLAFETLQQKYSKNYHFTIVAFGPVATGMNPYKKNQFLSISEKDAVSLINKAVDERKQRYEKPIFLFLFVKIVKLLPQNISNLMFSVIENLRKKLLEE
ncbi:MAG: KR domain protein [Candidatus Daviesbacteria bacterium GW2011_GWA2_38_24]|uniref:KR domain protein n=1 Tax=Candidatus Daviesbacteria bacterium GW2011_GWA2_38_24 TaxID=1618422 RepID=A0A0G0M0U1_9BACT|nr:MAG: KR domain protein [Candidatus Daviesbacteria bacterium GW2011_GWA2_38_24]KKQ80921.1 MAG: KR domain protein [Candidatus Daviesbacteria bacterium GW2011_GWA1_38_7]